MTAPDPGHVDPDIQAEWDRAEHELARRLRLHMVPHTADTLAAEFFADLSQERWRPPIRPAKPAGPPPEDPAATTARGYGLARQHLGLDQLDQEA